MMAASSFSLLNALHTNSHNASQPLTSSVLGLPQGQAPNGLDLDWEPFQSHVEAFLNAIDVYTVQAKTEISARAADHVALVRDLGAQKQETERLIQLERENEGEMLNALHQERTTLNDLSGSIQRLTSQLGKLQTTCQSLDDQAAILRNAAMIERAEKERQAKALDAQRERDGPELARMEELLGWKIEGVKQDLLLMRFTLVDPAEPLREFAICLDVSKQDYTVPSCSPPLAVLPELVKTLNEDREFFAFIKAVRQAFKASIPEREKPGTTLFADLKGPSRAPSPAPGRTLTPVPSIEVSAP